MKRDPRGALGGANSRDPLPPGVMMTGAPLRVRERQKTVKAEVAASHRAHTSLLAKNTGGDGYRNRCSISELRDNEGLFARA